MYRQESNGDGFTVVNVSGGMGWGIGHTFRKQESADAAAKFLNDLIEQDSVVEEIDPATVGKPTAVITRLDGRKLHVVIQREDAGWYWATNGKENSDQGYTLRPNGEARREKYKNGERLTSDRFGTWAMS